MQTNLEQAPETLSREQRSREPLTFASFSVAHVEHPERNEDTLLVDRVRGLAAVFDGVGGVEQGDVASHTAARVLRTGWRRALSSVQPTPGLLTTEQRADVPTVLCSLTEEASRYIRTHGEQRVQEDGSEKIVCGKTTVALVVCCLDPKSGGYLIHYAHAGDSRIYLLPQGSALRRLTRDDGYFSLQTGKGILGERDALRIEQVSSAEELTEEERVHFEKRNGITQALGDDQIVVHCGSLPIFPGDRIVLSTDGIHDNLTDSEMEKIVVRSGRTTAARALVQQAIARSQQEHLRAKKDDMSAIVITYSGLA